MKKSSIVNHERFIRQETAKQNRMALSVMRDLVVAEMRPIVLALIERAKTGDKGTAELLFDRTFGKVKDNLELSGDVKFSLSSLAAEWEEQQRRKVASTDPELSRGEQEPEDASPEYSVEENAPTAVFERSEPIAEV